MMFDLTGMTALVTGASGGLGSVDRQGAERAGRAAGAVGVECRQARGVRGRAWRRSCRAAVRLSNAAAVDALVPQAVEALGGKLDILVNNAGDHARQS